MRNFLLLMVLLNTSICFSNVKKQSIEDQVSEMATYLKKYTFVKETFPSTMPNSSEKTRSAVGSIVGGFGAERIPYIINFKNVLRSYSLDGKMETIEFYSFEPLEFNYNGKEFKYKNNEEFLDYVARLAPKKTVYNIFISQAIAKGGGYLAAGVAGYVVGRSGSSSPGSTTTVNNYVVVSTPKEIMVQSKYERSKEMHDAEMSALSESVSTNFPKVTCNTNGENLIPKSTVSYKKENNVTTAKFQANGATSFLEWRQNDFNSSSILVFCENSKENCKKIEYPYFFKDYNLEDKLTTVGRKKELKDQKEKTTQLLDELKSSYDEYLVSNNEKYARRKFIEKKKIVYPKTSTKNDLEKRLDDAESVDRAYEMYLKSINADSPFSKDGWKNKASATIRSVMAMPYERFKGVYYRYLGVLGYADRQKGSKYPEDQWQATKAIVDQVIDEEIEKLRPFSPSNRWSYPGALELTSEHEKEFQATNVKKSPTEVEEKFKAVAKKVHDHLKLKPDQYAEGCVKNKNLWSYSSSDYIIVEYNLLKCSLDKEADALGDSDSSLFVKKSLDILEVANCCLDSSCKSKIVSRIRAQETQYNKVKQGN